MNKPIAGYAVDPWIDQADLKGLALDEGPWHKNGKMSVPDNGDIRLKLINNFHDSLYPSHVGSNKTTRLVSRYYWRSNMMAHVTNYVKACHSCQTVKAR